MKVSQKIRNERAYWTEMKSKDNDNLYIQGIIFGLKLAAGLAEVSEMTMEQALERMQAEIAEQI